MTSQESLVLDASVGVKWYRHERGSDDAYDILASARHGETRVAVPTHFVHEVLSVVRRDFRSSDVVPAWEQVTAAGIDIVPLTEEVVREAAFQCEVLGCTFYDALAPAVASLLGATLVSADARAHGAYPGVHLIG
jgi:predicted nucleic acid-binding protein